jgi:serine/threonine-protein kinase
VRVHDFGQARDGRLFCVMDLLEGQSLRSELERDAPFHWKRALRVAREIGLALAAAHEHGLVHRDIKPENVYVERDGHVKLLDFGLARSAEELGEVQRDPRAEGAGGQLGAMTLFGTPEYMAPEQAAGGRVDHRADLYALGCVLYEMLTGRLPFSGDSAVAVLSAKLEGSPEAVRERAPSLGIPKNVSRLVTRALARHPSRRFDSATAMAESLRLALEEPSRQRTRRRVVGGSVMAAVLAFAVVLVGRQARPWLEVLPARLPWLEAPPAGIDQPAESAPAAPGPRKASDGAAPDAAETNAAGVVVQR